MSLSVSFYWSLNTVCAVWIVFCVVVWHLLTPWLWWTKRAPWSLRRITWLMPRPLLMFRRSSGRSFHMYVIQLEAFGDLTLSLHCFSKAFSSSQYHNWTHPPSQHALHAVQSERPLFSSSLQTGKSETWIQYNIKHIYVF